MTATRTARFWAIAAGIGLWVVAAVLLWRTAVPADAGLPRVDAEQVFGARYLERSAAYDRGLRLFWLGATAAGLAVLVLAARVTRDTRRRGIGGGVVLGAVTLVAVWLARLPFILGAHWWRQRYGTSRAGYRAVLVESERLETLAVACVAIALAMLLARRLGDRWWLVGGPAFAAVGAAFLLLQPFFLSGLEPLGSRSLEAEIQVLAQRQGVGHVDARVEHQDSRAINAEFYGIGPTKRVILWNTALDGRLTRPEILALTAHEFGHVEARHVWKSIGWLLLFSIPGMYVVARATRRRGGLGRPAAVPVALLTFAVLELALLPLTNAISRRYEAEADWRGLQATRDPAAQQGLMRKLSVSWLAEPDPPRWAHIVFDTHPTPVERIAMARNEAAPRGGS